MQEFWVKLTTGTLMQISREDAEKIKRDFPKATIVVREVEQTS